MPRPEQIEKYAPQFVISSIRERSRFLARLEMTRKRIFVLTLGNRKNPATVTGNYQVKVEIK